MRRLWGSILLFVQGCQKPWVFEILFDLEGMLKLKSLVAWDYETPTGGTCKNEMHSVHMKGWIFGGVCRDNGKTRV